MTYWIITEHTESFMALETYWWETLKKSKIKFIFCYYNELRRLGRQKQSHGRIASGLLIITKKVIKLTSILPYDQRIGFPTTNGIEPSWVHYQIVNQS